MQPQYTGSVGCTGVAEHPQPATSCPATLLLTRWSLLRPPEPWPAYGLAARPGCKA